MPESIKKKNSFVTEEFVHVLVRAKNFSSVKFSSIVIGRWQLDQSEHVLIFVFYKGKYVVKFFLTLIVI